MNDDLRTIHSTAQAAALLDPLRLRILSLARTPASATEIATQVHLPRQRVNYHVRELARHKLLRRAGNRIRGNLLERRFVATAKAFLLSPALLGEVRACPGNFADTFSASYLMAVAAEAQTDVAEVFRRAGSEQKRVPTLAMRSEFRFTSAGQRKQFSEALQQAVIELVARHTSPPESGGRRYRLMVGCYPVVEQKGAEDAVQTR